jgi:hypothetical protein
MARKMDDLLKPVDRAVSNTESARRSMSVGISDIRAIPADARTIPDSSTRTPECQRIARSPRVRTSAIFLVE